MEKSVERSITSNIRYVLKTAWQTDKLIIAFILLQAVMGVFAPLFSIYLPSVILQGVTEVISLQSMLLIVAGLALGMAAFGFISTYIDFMIDTNLISNRIFYLKEIQRKWMDADYHNIESADGQNKFQKATRILFNDNSGAYGMLKTLGALLASALGIFLYTGIISKLSPVIVLVLVCTSLIHFFILKHVSKYEYQQRELWTPLDKKIDYILKKISDYRYGKDVKLYSIRGWLLYTLELLIKERLQWMLKIARHSYLEALSDALVLIIRDGVSYLFILRAILGGEIQLAEFVLYFGAITGFSTFITSIIEQMTVVIKTGHDIDDIMDFLEMPDCPTGSGIIDEYILARESISIQFNKVSFRYAEDSPFILEDLSFIIHSGEKIALVGENGAGKTTLVKLLCGFYRPTKGEIYINGTQITELNRDYIYSLYSVVFQDMFILPMTVAQNVALMKEASIDYTKVRECLDQVGLGERITDLQMPLTKMIDPNGIDLSGGETQKLMLARAIYKKSYALILDEPTAALDPIAEARLYSRYNEIVQEKTAIFISHRLASTRFCDCILYLEGGRIIETGSHDELIGLNGKYKKIFDIQSHYYKEESVL